MTTAVAEDRRVWKIPGMPHRGWECIHVVDLNPDELPAEEVDYATCEACGQHPIRFVHTIVHDAWPCGLDVGRVCVEHLTGDYVNPRLREGELKRKAAARRGWAKKPWRTSANGNTWMKTG